MPQGRGELNQPYEYLGQDFLAEGKATSKDPKWGVSLRSVEMQAGQRGLKQEKQNRARSQSY